MKLFILFALAITGINSANAAAPTREQMILQHPVVVAVEKLMNDKDAGQCVLPQESDIRWMCTGAIKPVTKPEINATGCGFAIEVKCPSQTATIYGDETSYFLNQSLDEKHPLKVAPVSGGTNINSVRFN